MKIVVTGGLGFIGSNMIEHLKENGYNDIICVDKHNMYSFLDELGKYPIDAIIHLGACTDTCEFDYSIHEELNVEYPKKLWAYASQNEIPFIYASSAATYGDGQYGYDDTHHVIFRLEPLNPYGVSKNEFDKWAVQQEKKPPFWAGLKFFNVYGYNESHKGKMASMVYHAYNQIKENGKVKLFKSYKNEYKDGGQLRDFIYVKDVVEVILWMLKEKKNESGLYNLGTGKTESFLSLAYFVFNSLNLEPNIEFIDMPREIHSKYQYYTKANIIKLYKNGYNKQFTSLEDGVKDYVVNYLNINK
jgi:ADP-L-glycero-D-manno-heptose 6-epimerase